MAVPAMPSPLRQAWSQEQFAEAQMPATSRPSVKAWSLAYILTPAETQPLAVNQPLRRDWIAKGPVVTQTHPIVHEESETSRGENILRDPVTGHDLVGRDSRKLTARHPSSPEPPPSSLSNQPPPKSPAQAGREADAMEKSTKRTRRTHIDAQLQLCASQSSTKRIHKRKRKRNADPGHIGDDQWKVKQVVAKRHNAKRGQTANIEWLVDWDGTNPRTGKPWPMSWEKDEDVSEDLKVAYEEIARRGTSRRGVSRSFDERDASSCETDDAKSPWSRSKLRATSGAFKQTSITPSDSRKEERSVSTKRASSTTLPSPILRSSKVPPNAEHLTTVISSASSERSRETERQQEDEEQAAQAEDKAGDERSSDSLKPGPDFDSSTGAYGADGLYIVRRVVGVKKARGRNVRCRVEWEGNDPATGRPWAPTWEPIRSIPAAAMVAWRAAR